MTKCPIRMGEIHRAAGKQAKLCFICTFVLTSRMLIFVTSSFMLSLYCVKLILEKDNPRKNLNKNFNFNVCVFSDSNSCFCG